MVTNRDYYSWSQHNLFKSSKLQFYKRYVLGEDGPNLPAFRKGKEFADYRETGDKPHWVDDPLLTPVSLAIPRLSTPEKKIEVEFSGINLMGYIDECEDDLTQFSEFKTGKNPWTQKMVNEHKQLDFYAVLIYLLSGEKILPKCTLYWIETEELEINGEKRLMYTGNVESFTKQFTLLDIENMAIDIVSTYHEIMDYEHEEIELEEDQVERFIAIQEEIKTLNREASIIKLKVLDDLNSFGAKYASSSKGRFSISQRKSPIYSSDLIVKQNQYKDEIDKLKKAEKDSPDCRYSITESLLFKTIK